MISDATAPDAAVTELVLPLVDCVVQGRNAALVVYGASGSGKSFTLEGNASVPGAVQEALKQIFQCMYRVSLD